MAKYTLPSIIERLSQKAVYMCKNPFFVYFVVGETQYFTHKGTVVHYI